MSSLRCVLATLLSLVFLADFAPAKRAFADDEVNPLTLVSDSAAVCLEVPRFEATWTKFHSSRLAARLKEFPPAARFLGGAGFQKWTLVEAHVRLATGKSLSQHLLGAFSESLVAAIYLPDGKPPEGVVIAQARDVVALKQALQAWDTLEPQRDSRSKEHRGQAYVRRAKSASSSEVVYYTTYGRTIALSDQEHLIHQVIEFHAASRQNTPVGDAPRLLRDSTLYQANKARLPGDAVAFLFVNTRKWDRVLDDAVRPSPDAEWIRSVIRNIAAIAVALRVDDEFVVDLVADTSGATLPAKWREFVAGTSGHVDWSQRIPTAAVAAVSSRMEVGPLVQAWLSSTADAKSDDFARGRNALKSLLLGRDLFTEILPRVLRDWTIAAVSIENAESDAAPLELVGQFALNQSGRPANEQSDVEHSVDHALQFGMTFLGAALSHQRGAAADPVLVKTETSANGTTRSLDGIKSWSPSYVLARHNLTIATSTRALLNSQSLPRETQSTMKSRLAVHEQRYFRSTTQLAWLDAARLRSLLGKRTDWIASQLAPESTEGRLRVQKHLSKLEEAAKVFDAAFVAARLDEDCVRIVFGAALDRNE